MHSGSGDDNDDDELVRERWDDNDSDSILSLKISLQCHVADRSVGLSIHPSCRDWRAEIDHHHRPINAKPY